MPKKSRADQAAAKVHDYKVVFGSEAGERVLYDLMRSAHVLSTTFSVEPCEMAMREGERNIVLRILTVLKMDPEKLRAKIAEGEQEYE